MPRPPATPRRAARRKRDAVALLLAALLGVVLGAYFITLRLQAGQPQHADLRVFYGSARMLLQGHSIYALLPADYLAPDLLEWERPFLRGNLNPPFQTVLMAPLGLLSYPTAYTVWASLSLLSGVAAVWLLCRHLGYSRPRELLGASLVLLASYGAWHSTAGGQFGMVLLLALVLGWVWLQRDSEASAGLILGLALSLKLFVGVYVLVLAAQRRWRALAWLTIGFVACGAIAAVVAGPHSYVEYLGILRGVKWLDDGRNASIVGFVPRVVSQGFGLASPQAAGAAAMAGRTAALLLLAATTYGAWDVGTDHVGRGAGFVAAVPAMLLASPLGWTYYFPVLALPLLSLWRAAGESGRPRARLALALSWLLPAVAAVAEDSPLALSALPFLGLIGFWGVSMVHLWQLGHPHPEPAPARHAAA